MIERLRHRLLAGGPVEQVAVGLGQQRLEPVKLRLCQLGQPAGGEAAEQDVVLVRPHVMGTEQQTFETGGLGIGHDVRDCVGIRAG
ncbi:MAG: hypothetical protein RLZZ501_1017 [Pseudomonadota bacterium]